MTFLKDILRIHNSRPSAIEAATDKDAFKRMSPFTVGSFGGLVFEVSQMKVLTLRDFKRQARARYATHEVFGQKSVLEKVGLEPDEITFDIQLHARLGVNVTKEMGRLLDMVRNGDAKYLVLGSHVHGQYKWIMESVSFKEEYATGVGDPMFVTATVTLREVLQW